ncbi:hypothetical protein HJFPF1_07308 [Paramyrothecium foliicola]|nr:hypothetical protein HJFPF1_07308 [Paramyrothecium foliicola]
MVSSASLRVLDSLADSLVTQHFEPGDLSVTKFLLRLGLDVTQYPGLLNFVKRSPAAQYSTARPQASRHELSDAKPNASKAANFNSFNTIPDIADKTQERILYVKGHDWDNVKLSGVGACMGDVRFRAPSDASQRHNDQDLDADSVIPLVLNVDVLVDEETLEFAYHEDFWGYGFHAACWDILTRISEPDYGCFFRLCMSTPSWQGFLDWEYVFARPPGRSKADWLDRPEPVGVRSSTLAKGGFILDPISSPGIQAVLETPPVSEHEIVSAISPPTGGSEVEGYIHPRQETTLVFREPRYIKGWHLALGMYGVRALAVMTDDNVVSSWVGEPEGIPRWHIVRDDNISAVKAEFDGFRLLTLSRDVRGYDLNAELWYNACLWEPDVPPPRLFFKDNEGSLPRENFDHPYGIVNFGGVDGSELSQLVKVVVHIYDVYSIFGLEFHYTDPSMNKVLGKLGPYPTTRSWVRSHRPADDRRVEISIGGPGGERITSIEVQTGVQYVCGLKVYTNFGEMWEIPSSPEDQIRHQSDKWTKIEPEGSTVIGFFVMIWRQDEKAIF